MRPYPFAMALSALAVISVGAGVPHEATGRTASRVHTLVTTGSPIVSFAQDGTNIAWVTADVNRAPCSRTLHIRSLRSGHTDALRIGCRNYKELALAGKVAIWKNLLAGGNGERDLRVMRVAAGEPRPHEVERIHLQWLDGLPILEPVLVGAGTVLAYTVPFGVRRIVGRGFRRAFGFDGALGLAVNRGRIAVVGQQFRPGDGCGCLASPDWSPDGRRVAFLTGKFFTDDDSLPVGIGAMNADGTGRTVVVDDGLRRTGLDWSPDGSKLAYSYNRHNPFTPAEIAVADADGANAHDLAPGEDPAWSPDGMRLAFTRVTAGTSQIYVMDADGSNVQPLTGGGTSDGPAWSPDGTRIAYNSGGLRVMNADGTGNHLLVAAFGREPDWSPDGRQIVLAATRGIAVVNADGQDFHLLTNLDDYSPKWSPDGRTILFASLRNDLLHNHELDFELFLMDSDGSNIRALSFGEPQAWASPGQIRSGNGNLLASFEAAGMPTGTAVALGGRLVAVLTRADFSAPPRIELYDASTGAKRGAVDLPWDGSSAALGGISDGHLVYFLNGRIRTLALRRLSRAVLAVPRGIPIGLSVSGTRVAWAEKLSGRGRIRAISLP